MVWSPKKLGRLLAVQADSPPCFNESEKLSHPLITMTSMETAPIDEAITWLEKANADLTPELLSAGEANHLLTAYARAEKLVAFGKTVLASPRSPIG